ncbi:MAG: ABC transporter permease [Flavobacteriaceae bacterium]
MPTIFVYFWLVNSETLKFNYELFVAQRIVKSKQNKSSISAPIIKIAITAIALGMIVMLVAVATGVGLQVKIREKIAGFKGHVQITNFHNNTSQITDNPIDINQSFYPDFESVSGVSYVQPFATKFGVVRSPESFQGILYKGVDSTYNWTFFEEYLVEGRVPNLFDKRSNEILVSKLIAEDMKYELGDKVNTFFLKDKLGQLPNRRIFTVVGIYDTGYKEFDESLIYGDLRHIQRLNKWESNQVGGFEVVIDDFDQIQVKGVEIYNQIGSSLTSNTILEEFPAIFDWLAVFDNNIVVILIIMIMIAGINMITALLVLILERTQLIGILKALGASSKSIAKIFLYNAAYLILKGLFWGNIIGIGILWIQDYFGLISLDPQTYYVNTAPIYFSWISILALNIGTLLVCLLMLLLPAAIISKIEPSKVIKFE